MRPAERPHSDVIPAEACLRVTTSPGCTALYRQFVLRTGVHSFTLEGRNLVTVGAILLGQKPKCRSFLCLGYPTTGGKVVGGLGHLYASQRDTYAFLEALSPHLDGFTVLMSYSLIASILAPSAVPRGTASRDVMCSFYDDQATPSWF